ncbi:MAG: hypothetical protein OEZ05_10860 [Nitrospirota bacterium]|nr:hypothetical protein [Nitrospirota bacterium]
MDQHESHFCRSPRHELSALRRQNTRIKTWLMTIGIFVTLAQPMWAVAGPPDHAKAVFMRGEVTMIHIDEIVPEQSRFAYFLRSEHATDPEDVLEMIFEGEPPFHLATGKKVSVKGRAVRGKIWVTEVAALDGDASGATSGGTAAAATTGDRKTITFVINMSGVDYAAQGASPYTQSSVDLSGKYMHDSSSYSVHSAYREASFGQVTFSGSAATDVFLVEVPYDSAEGCGYRTIASQADAVSPVNLNGYVHKMYVVPPKAISGCGWLALGEVGSYGSTSTRKSWSTRIDPLAFAHELGHNLGYHHAATDPDNDGTKNVEYGDTSDLMGYCCAKRKLNSVHVDQIGWFDRADLQSKIVDVTSTGQFTLAPLGTDPSTSSDPQILRITTETGWPYYLSYRQKTGLDSALSTTYTTGVNIHRGLENGNWSYLIKVLTSDASDPNVNQFHDVGSELAITQIENNANYVKVNVTFGGECIAGTPNVSVTPASQVLTSASQLQDYQVTVTNTDTSACESSTWSVGLTSPLSGTVGAPMLTVAPGASAATTVHMDIAGVEDGLYPVTIHVADTANVTHDAQAAASLTLNVNTCVLGAPTVTLAPGQQMISDVSQLQAYTLNVTNRDSDACSASTWSVGVTSGLGSSVTTPLLPVMPGATGSTSIMMTVAGVADGTYPISVAVTDGNSGHNGMATGSLQMDLTAPTAPMNVTAQLTGKGRNKSVQVSWGQASDGSGGTGVSSYSVYRNGVLLGSTTSLSFKDSNYSTTVSNTYEVYAIDQVGHRSLTAGTAVYTDGGGSTGPGGGKGKKK